MLRRTLGAAAALLTASASLAFAAGTASASVSAAGAPAPAACTTTVPIQVAGFSFNPGTVARGQSSTATLTLHNCTSQTQQLSETWYGRYLGSSTGIPAGCPVIDPFLRSVSLPPFATASSSTTYSTFAGCAATALQITVNISNSAGTQLAQAVATLNIVAPPAA